MDHTKKRQRQRAVIACMLLLTAFIWGTAFVAQSAGMDYIGPFTFNCARSILGGIVLIPVIYVLDKKKKKEVSQGKEVVQNKKTLIIGGVCCGFFLMLGSSLQQIGIQYTTAGKAGFITALYILIVPILGLAVGKKAGIKVWIGVVLAVIGMYFLCMTSGLSIAKGDFYILLGSVAFSFHIKVCSFTVKHTFLIHSAATADFDVARGGCKMRKSIQKNKKRYPPFKANTVFELSKP